LPRISAADNCRTGTWGHAAVIILRMTCSLIQPNLRVGPDPRDDEDFKNVQSLKVTAVLSLQDEEDRGDGGIESERAAAARVGLAFESVPVKDFSNADLQLRLPKCVAVLAHLLGEGHTVYVHCTAGVSRSPSVVAAYLHWCSGWDLDQALVHVMECRRCRRCYPIEDAIRNAHWTGSTGI
jgi:protein-tyrosine phosphatase